MFRRKQPNRTLNVNKCNNYRHYRPQLRLDFNTRCGYCDSKEDLATLGNAQFHIDHFAPKKKFPSLENEYSNLIYSCSRCNIAKNDDWISSSPNTPVVDNKGYIDPCAVDYNDHFDRDNHGNIIGITQVAIYMIGKLKLYRIEYGIIWALEQIDITMDILEQAVCKRKGSLQSEEWEKLWDVYVQGRGLQKKLKEYFFK